MPFDPPLYTACMFRWSTLSMTKTCEGGGRYAPIKLRRENIHKCDAKLTIEYCLKLVETTELCERLQIFTYYLYKIQNNESSRLETFCPMCLNNKKTKNKSTNFTVCYCQKIVNLVWVNFGGWIQHTCNRWHYTSLKMLSVNAAYGIKMIMIGPRDSW